MKRTTIILLILASFFGCVMPNQPAEQPPEEALSHEDLLSNLDALQGPSARHLQLPDRSKFMLSSGSYLSTQDLATYLRSLKTDLAGYIYASANSKPYIVVPVRLAWASAAGVESGLMWVPFTWGRRERFPVISFQHGTQVFEQSAPSRFHPNPLVALSSPDLPGALQNYVECIVGALMASAGYIVVMPDYVGFGANTVPDHPYVTMALGESVTGILAAAQAALSGKRVRPDGKVFLTGYSEGGYATMAGARSLQEIDAPPIAVVPCDGAYDLSGTMLDQMLNEEVKVPSYLPYAISGYHAVYPSQIDYSILLRLPFSAYLEGGLFDGTHTSPEIDALGLPSRPADMLTPYATSVLLAPGGTVYNLLAANNAWSGWQAGPSVVFVHCPQDDVVPYQNAEVAQAALLGLGVFAPIVDVPPIAFVEQLAGSVHMAAFPTAMLAAFTIIESLN